MTNAGGTPTANTVHRTKSDDDNGPGSSASAWIRSATACLSHIPLAIPELLQPLHVLRDLRLPRILARNVPLLARELGREVLLVDHRALEVVRVLVALAVAEVFHESGRCVADVQGHRQRARLLDL